MDGSTWAESIVVGAVSSFRRECIPDSTRSVLTRCAFFVFTADDDAAIANVEAYDGSLHQKWESMYTAMMKEYPDFKTIETCAITLSRA